jgi:pSer/pThr/pTyr-binding forkhead associated (FHA) protein
MTSTPRIALTHLRLPSTGSIASLRRRAPNGTFSPHTRHTFVCPSHRCRYRFVEDQGSTNGVYVDESKVKGATELKEGTIVCFGAPEYRYLVK